LSGFTTCTVTVGNGFKFEESGTNTVTLTVLVTPILELFVTDTGNDTTGCGTAAQPFRTITKALQFASAIPTVNVGPGTYDTVEGEVFPLNVPAGVSVIGTMGVDKDNTDSTVVDPNGTASAVVLAASASVKGALKSLVITNFKGNAINMTGWRGVIDNLYVHTGVAGAAVASFLYSENANVDLELTNTTVSNITNNSSNYVMRFYNGTGPIKITNCVFQNLVCYSDGNKAGPIMFKYTDGAPGNACFTVTISDSVFDNIAGRAGAGNSEGGIISHFASAFTVQRCVFKNMTTSMVVLSPNRVAATVRDCLFFNLQCGTEAWQGAIGGYSAPSNVYNSTFDNCSAAFAPQSVMNIYNTSVSNCPKLNAGLSGNLRLHYANVYNSPTGTYDTANSNNVTEHDPNYKNAASRDYRLKKTSLLIDAGNNATVVTGETDLLGKTRIMDGNGDTIQTVDIGAYEHDPNVVDPTFNTPAALYHVFAGERPCRSASRRRPAAPYRPILSPPAM